MVVNAPSPEVPPFGSWPRTYAMVCISAIAVILVLWWVTATYDQGRPA